MSASVRWACNVAKWEPTEKEFLVASSCLQFEEKFRIDKFVFKKDVKASLAGRLMIRKFVSESTGLPYNSILLLRDINGKPYYKINDPKIEEVSFNVSHHGAFTVLAGEMGKKNVGIDVMKLEYNGGRALDDFFRIMERKFSDCEWKKIKGSSKTTNQNKVAMFYRNWALKESYVKARGIGLTIDLGKIIFDIQSELQENKIVDDTCLYINKEKQAWIFQESLLDSSHCVAVALEQKYQDSDFISKSSFKYISPENLLENAVPLLPQDFEYCKRYFSKNTC